ncbi:hypothetical protein EYR36_005006 [Pleurotus pulmonarius]|nr:hypothetical protein EYR36_005006 [Pleurotus pulmonarius]
MVDVVARKGDVNSISGPATTFHRGMISAYTCLKSSPHDVREDTRFMISKFLVSLCMDGLEQHIGRPRPDPKHAEECKDYIDKTVYYVKSAMQSLKVFLRDLNEIDAERKAASKAPVAPFLFRKVAKPKPSKISLATSTSPTLVPPPPARRKDVSSVSGLPVLSCIENKDIARRKSPGSQFLHNLLKKFRKSKVTLPFASSSVTLVELPSISDTSAIKDALLPDKPKVLPEIPYDCRNSAVYFPTGVDFSKIDMQRLMPTYDDSSIHLTVDGALKSASLTSLIRILTSPEAARFSDFTHTFFVCFGFFTSPEALLDGLIERFHVGKKWQRPGLSSDESKLMEAQVQAVRVSVVRALTTWLWEYWRPETDKVLLQQIMDFASREIAEVVPDLLLVWGLAQAVWNIDSKKNYRGIKLESSLEVPMERTLPVPTCFCVWDGSEHTPSISKVLSTEAGREEFVRQITIKASEMFASINPSDAIRYWEAGKRGFDRVRRKIDEFKTFERGVIAAVVTSILAIETTVERTIMLEHWLDVASRCVTWRNYCVANCISSAIQSTSVFRLKTTIALAREESKEQFTKLAALFVRDGNFSAYRIAIAAEKGPAVPPIFHFEHDISAIEGLSEMDIDGDGQKTVLIKFNQVKTIMKVLASMQECRIDYCLPLDGDFQDWLKRHIDKWQLTSQSEQDLMNKHYAISQLKETSCPRLQQKGVDVWSHPITFYWADYPGPFRTERNAPSLRSSRSIPSKR